MASVSGRVVDASGTPVPGAYVYATPVAGARFGKAPGTHTRRDGRWTLELPAGAWTVRETGHAAHDVVVGGAAVDLDVTAPSLAPQTPHDDLARLLERRRAGAVTAAPSEEPSGPERSRARVHPRQSDHAERDAYMAQIAQAGDDTSSSRLVELMARRRSTREET